MQRSKTLLEAMILDDEFAKNCKEVSGMPEDSFSEGEGWSSVMPSYIFDWRKKQWSSLSKKLWACFMAKSDSAENSERDLLADFNLFVAFAGGLLQYLNVLFVVCLNIWKYR